jgi:hypothetical protein
VALRGGQEAGALLGAQELDRLHRHDDQGEALLAEVEARGVGLGDRDVELLRDRAVVQRREQVAVAVERDHGVAGARQVQRDAPGARPDVEDRAARLARQRPPQRQVGLIAAALDVVPDDHRRRGQRQRRLRDRAQVPASRHRQYSSASPRWASSSRSSSSAV